MEAKQFNTGAVIFRQGEPAEAMYEICGGAVGIYVWYGTPQEMHLVTFGPGDVFGEVELIETCTRSASAVALEDGTQVREIGREEFADWFRDEPEKVLAVMRQVSRRIRDTTRRYLEACRSVYETVETEKKGGKGSWLAERLAIFYRIGQLLKK